MESPSAQLMEPSMIDFDGPPSSPFVTEVDTHSSRSPSKQWKASQSLADVVAVETQTVEPEHKQDMVEVQDMYDDDKENQPQNDPTLAIMFASPKKSIASPAPAVIASPAKSISHSSTNDADLMPPPSMRKVSSSPKKTPLKSSASSGARTPKSLSRGNSFERTPQSVSTFQAGLDLRNASIPTDDTRDVDETCCSAFSEMPDITKFGQSPTKRSDMLRTPRANTEATPRTSRKRSSPSRSPSPTRRAKTPAFGAKDDTTSFLIDFTQQFEGLPSARGGSPAKSATESNLLNYITSQRSPAKPKHNSLSTPTKPHNNSILNLLDFELPPAPTPRSVPTITVRELESLKSSYLSQISSLKATLSGREAEVESLKKAVTDAERRVGEAQESLREEKNRKEYAEQEVAGWKKRGEEFEVVLRSVKEEVLKSEAEREEMGRRFSEVECRADEAEGRAVKAEERFADALAARASGAEGGEGVGEEQVQRLVAAQIDAKIEAVSRELHGVYKEKHERKVATLKKSYESRNEKKTAELQHRVSELEKVNEELQIAKDATFSGPVSDAMLTSADNVELKAQLEAQTAALARFESEMLASRHQQDELMRELQQERIEKGDLVAAVDEMLALQADTPATPSGARALSVVEDFRKSISRPASGLRAPGAGGSGGGVGGGPGGESKIGRGIPTPGRSGSGSGAGKSRMLANIERMGRTGSKDGLGTD